MSTHTDEPSSSPETTVAASSLVAHFEESKKFSSKVGKKLLKMILALLFVFVFERYIHGHAWARIPAFRRVW
jgi:hypothetical protein